MSMSRNAHMIAYLCVLVGVFGHASSEFVAVQTGVVGPELSVWRFFLGGAGLLGIALAWPTTRDLITPLRRDGVQIVALSILGMAFGQLLFHWSLDLASVVQVATVVTCMPVFVVLMNFAINREGLTAPKIVSGLGAIVSIMILMTDGYLDQIRGDSDSFPGVIMALTCALVGAGYIILSKPIIHKYGAIRTIAYTFSIGFFALWVVVGAIWGIWVNPATLFDRPMGQAVAILTMGCWNTTIAMVLWLGGLAALPDIGRANYLFFLKPVIAAGLAYFFLGDAVTIVQMAAIFVICACVSAELFWDHLRAAYTNL
jgi:drug/metabolite transporter (DMT)-like permease